MLNLTAEMLRQLRVEKDAIDTTIAALEDLLRKQDRASRQGKRLRVVEKISVPQTSEK